MSMKSVMCLLVRKPYEAKVIALRKSTDGENNFSENFKNEPLKVFKIKRSYQALGHNC